ncbi:MAG: HEAT repeat domain-containing protein [Candidatus Omnitrophica bacterium]|nr:HEAT repeat domain-containing protein [Candidatus Omnitrophota bacterium]
MEEGSATNSQLERVLRGTSVLPAVSPGAGLEEGRASRATSLRAFLNQHFKTDDKRDLVYRMRALLEHSSEATDYQSFLKDLAGIAIVLGHGSSLDPASIEFSNDFERWLNSLDEQRRNPGEEDSYGVWERDSLRFLQALGPTLEIFAKGEGSQRADFASVASQFKLSEEELQELVNRVQAAIRYDAAKPDAGLEEELLKLAKELEGRLLEQVEKEPKLEGLRENLKEWGINLKDTTVLLGIHLGANVLGSSSPPMLNHLLNEFGPVRKALGDRKIVHLPFNVPGTPNPSDPLSDIQKILPAILKNPRFALATFTEPHKGVPVQLDWVNEREEETGSNPSVTFVLLERDPKGQVKTVGMNGDGPAFLIEVERAWGPQGGQQGGVAGKNVVLGAGGLGISLVSTMLNLPPADRPARIVLTEVPGKLAKAKETLEELLSAPELKLSDAQKAQVILLSATDPNVTLEIKQADWLVDATGLGTDPLKPEETPLPDPSVFSQMKPDANILQAPYRDKEGRPVLTRLIRDAYSQGIPTHRLHNGLRLAARSAALEVAWLVKRLTGKEIDVEMLYQETCRYIHDDLGMREAKELLRSLPSHQAGLEEGWPGRVAYKLLGLVVEDPHAWVKGLRRQHLERQLKHRDPTVRRDAASALGEMKDLRTIPALIKALKNPDPFVRRIAANVLKKMHRDPQVGSALLIEALKDPDPDIRKGIAFVLGSIIRDRQSIPTLIKVLKEDGDSGVRESAAYALLEITGVRVLHYAYNPYSAGSKTVVSQAPPKYPEAVTLLQSAARETQDPAVRFTISWILEQFQPNGLKQGAKLITDVLSNAQKERFENLPGVSVRDHSWMKRKVNQIVFPPFGDWAPLQELLKTSGINPYATRLQLTSSAWLEGDRVKYGTILVLLARATPVLWHASYFRADVRAHDIPPIVGPVLAGATGGPRVYRTDRLIGHLGHFEEMKAFFLLDWAQSQLQRRQAGKEPLIPFEKEAADLYQILPGVLQGVFLGKRISRQGVDQFIKIGERYKIPPLNNEDLKALNQLFVGKDSLSLEDILQPVWRLSKPNEHDRFEPDAEENARAWMALLVLEAMKVRYPDLQKKAADQLEEILGKLLILYLHSSTSPSALPQAPGTPAGLEEGKIDPAVRGALRDAFAGEEMDVSARANILGDQFLSLEPTQKKELLSWLILLGYSKPEASEVFAEMLINPSSPQLPEAILEVILSDISDSMLVAAAQPSGKAFETTLPYHVGDLVYAIHPDEKREAAEKVMLLEMTRKSKKKDSRFYVLGSHILLNRLSHLHTVETSRRQWFDQAIYVLPGLLSEAILQWRGQLYLMATESYRSYLHSGVPLLPHMQIFSILSMLESTLLQHQSFLEAGRLSLDLSVDPETRALSVRLIEEKREALKTDFSRMDGYFSTLAEEVETYLTQNLKNRGSIHLKRELLGFLVRMDERYIDLLRAVGKSPEGISPFQERISQRQAEIEQIDQKVLQVLGLAAGLEEVEPNETLLIRWLNMHEALLNEKSNNKDSLSQANELQAQLFARTTSLEAGMGLLRYIHNHLLLGNFLLMNNYRQRQAIGDRLVDVVLQIAENHKNDIPLLEQAEVVSKALQVTLWSGQSIHIRAMTTRMVIQTLLKNARETEQEPPPDAGLEEWGADVWDRLYEIAEVPAVKQLLKSILYPIPWEEGYIQIEAADSDITENWGKIVEALSDSKDLQETASVFQTKVFKPYQIYGTLLYDNDKEEGVLFIGGSGIGKTGLAVSVLDFPKRGGRPQTDRWDVMGDDTLIGFMDEGKLYVGHNPSADVNHLNYANGYVLGQWDFSEGFVPVGRVFIMTESNDKGDKQSVGDFVLDLMSTKEEKAFLPPDMLQALNTLPSTRLPVPDQADLQWYKEHAKPIVEASGLEEGDAKELRASLLALWEEIRGPVEEIDTNAGMLLGFLEAGKEPREFVKQAAGKTITSKLETILAAAKPRSKESHSFNAVMAHKVNNLLTGIVGYADLYSIAKDIEGRKKRMEQVRDGLRDLANFFTDVGKMPDAELVKLAQDALVLSRGGILQTAQSSPVVPAQPPATGLEEMTAEKRVTGWYEGLTKEGTGQVADEKLMLHLMPGEESFVVEVKDQPPVTVIYREKGMELQAELVDTVGGENIRDLPEGPADVELLLRKADPHAIVLLKPDSRITVPSDVKIPVLILPAAKAAELTAHELSAIAAEIHRNAGFHGYLYRVSDITRAGLEENKSAVVLHMA